jgi:protein tyrosine phosphatase
LTRVKLQPDADDVHDFINANYVTGYNNNSRAYIFTQGRFMLVTMIIDQFIDAFGLRLYRLGPLQSTVTDFWRMIWQENSSIIVMTTNLRESGTTKCHMYWPMNVDDCLRSGSYEIYHVKCERYESFNITKLRLKKLDQSDARIIYHAHYTKWPDHGTPTGTNDALFFLDKVESYRQLTRTQAPIVLHCSAGIGRTGTFCAIDIGIKRYLDTRTIDIASTVVKMRHERAGSVQTEDQYVFIHSALMDYIRQQSDEEYRTCRTETSIESEPCIGAKTASNSSSSSSNEYSDGFLTISTTHVDHESKKNTRK